MCKVGLGLARVLGPNLTAPGGDLARRGLLGKTLPPDIAVLGEGNVGVDAVGVEAAHGVVVGVVGSARGDAEETGLGVDGVEAAVRAEFEPG